MKRRLSLFRLAFRSALRGPQGATLLPGTVLLALTVAIPALNPAFAAVLLLLVAISSSGVLGDSEVHALRGWLTPASVADWELGCARLLARTSLLLISYLFAVAVGQLNGLEFKPENIAFAVLVTLQTVSLIAVLSALLRPPIDVFLFLALQLVTLFQTAGDLPPTLRYALQPSSPAREDELMRLAIALGTAALAVFFFVVLGKRRHDA